MAERYSTPFVLEGNWQEQRAETPALVADGPSRWETTASATYGAIPRAAQRPSARAGIMGPASWNEVAYCTGGAAEGRGFDMTHGGRPMSKAEVAATFRSTGAWGCGGGCAYSWRRSLSSAVGDALSGSGLRAARQHGSGV